MTKPKLSKEPDSVFFLKILVLLIVSTLWLRFSDDETFSHTELSLPFGGALAFVLVQFDHFSIDRKIEYAVVLVATFISFFLPVGIII